MCAVLSFISLSLFETPSPTESGRETLSRERKHTKSTTWHEAGDWHPHGGAHTAPAKGRHRQATTRRQQRHGRGLAQASWWICSAPFCLSASLHRLPADLVAEGVASLSLPLAERARLHLALSAARPEAPQKSEDALVAYFSEKEKRANEKWRATAAIVAQQRAALIQNSAADLQELFLDLAKCGAVGAEDALTLAYLLFASDEDRLYYAGLLLTTAGAERVRAHNFTTAAAREKAFLSAYGPQLESFPWPIFPADKRFTALTQKLLSTTSLSGGAAPQTPPPVYKDVRELFGGSFLPIYGPNGVQIVTAGFSRLRNAASNQNRGRGGKGRGNRGRGNQGGQRGGYNRQNQGHHDNRHYANDGLVASAPPSKGRYYNGGGAQPTLGYENSGPKNEELDE